MRSKKKFDRYLSITDIAKLCGVSFPTAWKWVHRMKMRKTRIGKRWKVRESALREFLRRRVGPLKPPVKRPYCEYTLRELETRKDVFGEIDNPEIF